MSIDPFARIAASATRGSSRVAESVMTLTAAMGRARAAATLATTCDSISNRQGTGTDMQSTLGLRLGDRSRNTDNRTINRAGNGLQEVPRPIRGSHEPG